MSNLSRFLANCITLSKRTGKVYKSLAFGCNAYPRGFVSRKEIVTEIYVFRGMKSDVQLPVS